MGSELRPLLERHRVFHTKRADELDAFLQGIDFQLQISPRRARELNARMNGVYLPGIFIGYVQYQAPALVRSTPQRNDYWVHLPVRGHIQVTTGQRDIICSTIRAGIGSPTRHDYYFVNSEAGSAGIRLRVTHSFMLAQLTALLGYAPSQPPEFSPALDLTSGYGRLLAGYLRMAVSDLEQPDSALFNPFVMTEFEQFIANGMLMALPHSWSDALRRIERPVAPRDVKRARDYMQANLNAPITIAEIAEAAGVPGRTLFKHFRDCYGVSPMRYVRMARLDRIRDALLLADDGATITDIATHWGFGHLGRFSVEYRKKFGERPSDTLGQRRECKRR
jgi:AraC-like DNA-binding protein